MFNKSIISIPLLFVAAMAHGQRTINYNLVTLLKSDKLETTPARQTHVTDSTQMPSVSTKGIVFLKDVSFSEGTIEIDLRGKDVFLKSFLGMVFHAKDTLNYEVIYFRPFRFHSPDTATRKWSVQYMNLPAYNYAVLRKDHPGVYENDINPAPAADDWFHASIVVKGEWITVYVNHSKTPSLKVKKTGDYATGKIGLWDDDLSGDFANLSIRKD